MKDLDGKRALVCGSTRGIGRACAEELAGRGAAVTLVARDADALEQVLGALPGSSPHAAITADFRTHEELGRKVRAHVAEAGPIHILINNTGGPAAGPVLDADPEAFVEALRMHVGCNQVLVQALVDGMKSAKYGRILNIISTSVREPIPNLGVSNTTRGAVASWAKTLSRELGPFGITVNNVLPGFTDTHRLRSLIQNNAKRRQLSEGEIETEMKSKIPLGRFGDATEIAGAVGFLASPAAAYISGVSLPVDGGRITGV